MRSGSSLPNPSGSKHRRPRVLAGKAVGTRDEALGALKAFQRIIRPLRVLAVTTQEIDNFIAARRLEQGRKKGETLSPATVNKELRHLKAALREAKKWGYLHKVPEVDFEKEPGKLPTYVPPEHFAALYQACEGAARAPADQRYPAADWWRALLVTGYMAGWRIGQLLALRREDLDLDGGTALSWAKDKKGKRDQVVPLHALVIEHLRKLVSFDLLVYPWHHPRRRVFEELHRLQRAAKVKPAGKDAYGFHDLRRAFATLNADKMTADALQALTQHKSYQTTQGYINMARQLHPAVQTLFVPDLARPAAGKNA
jgi:integrase